MSVSRETKSVFLDSYCSLLNSPSVTFFDDLSFLPVLARGYYGSCLVGEDSSFGVVFDVLYRSSLSCFSVSGLSVHARRMTACFPNANSCTIIVCYLTFNLFFVSGELGLLCCQPGSSSGPGGN